MKGGDEEMIPIPQKLRNMGDRRRDENDGGVLGALKQFLVGFITNIGFFSKRRGVEELIRCWSLKRFNSASYGFV